MFTGFRSLTYMYDSCSSGRLRGRDESAPHGILVLK
jgi:hypothetical protein